MALLVLTAFLIGLLLVCAACLVLVRQGLPAMPETRAEMRATPIGPDEGQSALRQQLREAGFTHPSAVQLYLLAKFGLGLGAAALAFAAWSNIPALSRIDAKMAGVMALTCGALGYWAASAYIDKRRAAWRRRITVAVPDALDFMLVCVEAGQSIDLAAHRLAAELEGLHPDLAVHFRDLTEELAAGASREEAFEHLALATGNVDLRQFGRIVVQSSTLGTPMAQSLRAFATDLRDQRVRLVEEKANVLPTKMTLGTMLFTVPPLLILLLTPAVYRVLTML